MKCIIQKYNGDLYIPNEFLNLRYVKLVCADYLESVTTRRGVNERKLQTMYNILWLISSGMRTHTFYSNDCYAISRNDVISITGRKTVNESHHSYELWHSFLTLEHLGNNLCGYSNAYSIAAEFKDEFKEYIKSMDLNITKPVLCCIN